MGAAEILIGSVVSAVFLFSVYAVGTKRGVLRSCTDFVLLIMKIRLQLVPNLLESNVVIGLAKDKPLPSEKYLAIAAVFSLLKPQIRRDFKRGAHTAKDLRLTVSLLPLFYASVAHGTEVKKVKLNGVKAYWVRAAGVRRDAPVLLHLHGGGYAAGSAYDEVGFLSRWSKSLNVRALSVEYRLIPEHPFPAGVEDALAAYQWLIDQGVNPASICVTGASAGGGLALLLLQAIQRAGLPQPACAVPISSFADFSLTGSTLKTNKLSDLMLEVENFEYQADWALGVKDKNNKVLASKPIMERNDPRCSSLYGDFEGICPLFLMTGSSELLRDDSQRIAEKAENSGVKVELEIADHMIHMYPLFADRFPEADEAVSRMRTFLDKYLERHQSSE